LKKLISILLLLIGLVAVAFGGRLYMLGQNSGKQRPKNVGLVDGRLQACGNKPNCVSSMADPNSEYYIKPLESENIEGLWDDLNILLPDMGFRVSESQDNYLHFTETSKIFRFVDDIEFQLDREAQVIHMRSQSRVGYSDLGVNRKRLEKIRKTLNP
jgi:uncharacterized protein (DUF1499 family)